MTWKTLYAEPEVRYRAAMSALKASTGYAEESYWLGAFVAVIEESVAAMTAARAAPVTP
jgi:hypothetical protein